MSLRYPWKYLDTAVKCDEAVYTVYGVQGDTPGAVSSTKMGAPPPLPQHPCQHLLISAGELMSRRMDAAEWFALPFPPPLPLALQLHPACRQLPAPHLVTGCKTGPAQPAGEEARRPRGEKRPTPEDHKDVKYYERRKRNNQAAKKSRDARKFREDQIALRAMLLEQENRLLRAQLAALREEARALLLR